MPSTISDGSLRLWNARAGVFGPCPSASAHGPAFAMPRTRAGHACANARDVAILQPSIVIQL
jgi:hypothetical protein